MREGVGVSRRPLFCVGRLSAAFRGVAAGRRGEFLGRCVMVVAVGDILQANSQVIHSETTDLALNVWTFEVSVLPPGGDTDVVADLKEYVDNFFGAITANLSTEYTGGEITVFNRTQDNFVGANLLTWAGSTTPDALPPTVCGLYLGKTNTKRVSGRKYIVGIDQDAENTGRFTTAAITVFNLGIAKYTDAFVSAIGGEYATGVARESFGVWTFTPFTAGQFIVNNRTQRSRTIGRGI